MTVGIRQDVDQKAGFRAPIKGVFPAYARRIHPKKPHVLVIDDDLQLAQSLRSAFSYLGCRVHWTPAETNKVVDVLTNPTDLLVVDWSHKCLPVMMRIQEWLHNRRGTSSQCGTNRIGVITCDQAERFETSWPFCDHFEPIAHWQTPLDVAELMSKALEALIYVKQRST